MESSTHRKIVTVLDHMVGEVAALKHPPLGPSFKDLAGPSLHQALVSHRILNKYEVPTPGAAELRKSESIFKMLHHDSKGLEEFDYRGLPRDSRQRFLEARAWLSDFFKDFRHYYSLRFPTGEGFDSARGKTDLYHKIKTQPWTISPDLVSYLVEIIIRNRGLSSIFRERFKKTYGKRGWTIYRRLIRVSYAEGRDVRRDAARFLIRATCTLNRVSRVTTVPKNNREDRVITCESLWTMVCQLSYAASLRRHLSMRLGFVLQTRQDVHRSLIRTGKATIDLSKASDSNFMCVLRELWPKREVRTLENMRTGIFDTAIDGDFHPFRMFSPMGCGCTFEVMTLTLLAHSRVFDPGSSVFGDDIIISQDKADSFCHYLSTMGWVINTEKSFTEGNFRESCGSYADLTTNSFLLSYDLHRPSTLSECYVVAHKVLRLAHALSDSPLRSILIKSYARLVPVFPRDSLQGITGTGVLEPGPLSEYVFHVPDCLLSTLRTRRRTRVSAEISKSLQREVHICMRQETTQVVSKLQQPCGVMEAACFLHRGVYDPPAGKTRLVTTPTDLCTGTPLLNVPLLTVL